MTDIFAALTTECRIAGRIVRETLMGLKRTGWMNVIIIITMASILTIFGVVTAVVIQMTSIVQSIGSDLQIMAYLRSNVPIERVTQRVEQMAHVEKITVIPKAQAWKEMQQDYPFSDIDNPLPDTLHIQMREDRYIQKMVNALQQMKDIEFVQYPKSILTKVRQIAQGTSLAGVIVSIVLGLLTLFIISNTIHLLIQAKSREIEILRMMGVGNWYIRLPFLMQGALYGFIGSLLAYIPLYFAIFQLVRFFTYLGFSASDSVTNLVFGMLTLLGILVGAGGATLAVRKYLHV